LNRRAAEYGWAVILDIPDDLANITGTTTNLIDSYGTITLAHVRGHVATYLATQSRAAQDSMQLYECLMGSLSKEGRERVTLNRTEYMVNDLPSGVLLTKIIIRESNIDTNATISHIRTELSSLDSHLPSVGQNIEKMNIHVKQLTKQLKTC
jgi:hypothetical protein